MTALRAPVIFDAERRITDAGLRNSSATLLPIGSVLMTSRATLGIAAISYSPLATNQGFKSVVCGPSISNYYLLLHLLDHQEDIVSRANGSTFLEINASSFRSMPLLVPAKEVMQKFDRLADHWFTQIFNNEKENTKLAEIRDYLLPRLLSGALPVAAGEALAGTTADFDRNG